MVVNTYETVTQAAERLGVSDSLVRRWCREEKLKGIKVGRDWLVRAGAEPTVARRSRA